jgi:AcrR family transcriptional regulator
MKSKKTDPRVLRTQALLRQALEELITDKSFSTLTIGQVTAQAGLDRSTFYLHYSGLHALLEDCARELFAEMRSEIYANKMADYRSNPSVLEPFVASVFKHLEKHHRFYKAMLGRQGDPYFRILFQDQLSELIFEPVELRDSLDQNAVQFSMTLRFFSAGFAGLASWWLEKDMPIPLEEASHQVAVNILPGYMRLIE